MEFEYKIPVVDKNEESSEKEKTFEQKAEQLGKAILNDLERLYPDAEYEYHNRSHSEGVGNQADKFLEALPGYSADTRKRALVRLDGFGHDYDQTHIWVSAGDGLWKERKRNVVETGAGIAPDPGKIEKQSLLKLRTQQQEVGLDVTPEEASLQEEGLLVTVPGFGEVIDPVTGEKYFTVTQPNLNENSSPEAFAIAAADIASAGYDPKHFLDDGDNVFNEDFSLPRPETLNDEEAGKVLEKAVGWTKFQIQYAKGQKVLWSRDIIPDFLKQQLTHFDDTIALCEDRYKNRVALISQGVTPQEKLQLLLDNMKFKRFIQ